MAQLPKSSIENKTVLDLGSCLGAAGHHALTFGAKHYTGVEIQKYYIDTSKTLLERYWDSSKFTVIRQDIESFLDSSSMFDVVLASGVIYEFLDIVAICKKICQVANEQVIIDTKWAPIKPNTKSGIILLTPNEPMPNVKDKDSKERFVGLSSRINLIGLDLVMSTEGFYRSEGPVLPQKITDADDPYNDLVNHGPDILGPRRFIVRYFRDTKKVLTLNDMMKNEQNMEV